MKGERWDDENLLEWILNPERRAELNSDARAATRARELEAFLTACRRDLADEQREDEVGARRLAGRVLARTTREDLSWRADLGLVSGFVRRRLRDSLLLRLVAASLVVHLIAAPMVLAYFAFFAPRQLDLKYEPRVEHSLPEDPVEPARELREPADTSELPEGEPGGDDPDGAAPDGDERRQRR